MIDSPTFEEQNEFNDKIESRLTILENYKESMQVEMVKGLMEQVCHRINMAPA